MTTSFQRVPIVDYSLALSPATKPAFLASLREAVINVGFLYLSNHPIPLSTVDGLETCIPKLFALPQEEKDKISMKHSPHFLGYTALGKEFTKGKRDAREQFDFATEVCPLIRLKSMTCFSFSQQHASRWTPGAPDYHDLWGPSQVWCCYF